MGVAWGSVVKVDPGCGVFVVNIMFGIVGETRPDSVCVDFASKMSEVFVLSFKGEDRTARLTIMPKIATNNTARRVVAVILSRCVLIVQD